MLFVGVLAGPVSAKGKPGGKTGGKDGSAITLDQAGSINYGDTITFTISTTKTDRPFVEVECTKNGALVYSSTVGMFQDWYDNWGEPDFTLMSLAWGGGYAACVSSLQYQDRRWRTRTLATTSFHVSG